MSRRIITSEETEEDVRIDENLRPHCLDQYISFTVCIEGQPFQSCKPTFIDAHVELGAEFNRGFCFPSHDRSDVRLADTDDTVFDAVCAILVHVLLLLIKFANNLKQVLTFLI